jgi:hypothetical protein
MTNEFRNEDNPTPEPPPSRLPMPPAKVPMHWALKLLLVLASIVGIVMIGIVVLAGLVLATCALGR